MSPRPQPRRRRATRRRRPRSVAAAARARRRAAAAPPDEIARDWPRGADGATEQQQLRLPSQRREGAQQRHCVAAQRLEGVLLAAAAAEQLHPSALALALAITVRVAVAVSAAAALALPAAGCTSGLHQLVLLPQRRREMPLQPPHERPVHSCRCEETLFTADTAAAAERATRTSQAARRRCRRRWRGRRTRTAPPPRRLRRTARTSCS